MTTPRDRLAHLLRDQQRWCVRVGSPLYAELLNRTAADVDAGGPAWAILRTYADDPSGSAISLRFMGAIHRLVLDGRAPELARFYPSAGGSLAPEGAWKPFHDTLVEHAEDLQAEVARPVQTNEVGRSAALVGGFLLVARDTGLPLRVLEVGASAGLNLRWDHYHYEARGHKWGEATSPVRLCSYNTQRLPPFDVGTRVVERRGCDALPLDPTTEEGRLTLASFVWPDQLHRHRNLRGALEVARRVPVQVDKADGVAWLRRRLASPREGAATVVFHSILLQYLDEGARRGFSDVLQVAATRAHPGAPLAWLRMEPAGDSAGVWLTLWPGGEERLVARSGYHGDPVAWLV